MARQSIKEGYEVFVADGDVAFGAVRHVLPGSNEFTIYVEDSGEYLVPMSAVKDVHSDKVILTRGKLSQDLQLAIKHAHDEEHEDNT